MRALTEIFIPREYDKALAKLKEKSFAWKMEFSSKSDLANTGHITHYAIRDGVAHGNLVLVPGLASNTEIEPLMCAITYWALSHRYNIYAVDSFLGDFKSNVTDARATKNTMPEFIDLIDAGFDIVSKMSVGKWTCVIGHSLGGTGTLEVFNRHVLRNQPINFSGAILFAPFVVKDWCDFIVRFIKNYQYSDLSDKEFFNKSVGLVSPHDMYFANKTRYISVYPSIFYDVCALKPRMDLMARYNIPVTLVAGGRDKKSPIEYIRDVYDGVQKISGGANIKFVEFPKSKHSFIDQHNDWAAILRLIKSQQIRSTKQK